MSNKPKASFAISIQPRLRGGRLHHIVFIIGRERKKVLATTKDPIAAKILIDECKSVTKQPKHALKNMITALSLHPWQNTEAENVRLEAARLWKSHA